MTAGSSGDVVLRERCKRRILLPYPDGMMAGDQVSFRRFSVFEIECVKGYTSGKM